MERDTCKFKSGTLFMWFYVGIHCYTENYISEDINLIKVILRENVPFTIISANEGNALILL